MAHAMLFSSTSSTPKTRVGLTMAYGTPKVFSASSTRPLPLKYGSRDPESALVMETWTIRVTPASLAASNSAVEFSTARSKVVSPRANLTQYVL